MRRTISRWVWIAAAVALTAPVPAAPAPAQACPPGEHEDTQTAGGQCVPGWCPPGMLLDGITRVCVTAPEVGPPALTGD